MIHSMTSFASARAESAQGSLNLELRTVNSRFLDIHIRISDELRFLEGVIRDAIGSKLARGKADVRVSHSRNNPQRPRELDLELVSQLGRQLAAARSIIPDVAAPRLHELLQDPTGNPDGDIDADMWTSLCIEACNDALIQLQGARRREGQRLATMMLATAHEMQAIVDKVETRLPELTTAHQEKVVARLREVLEAASPAGFAQISGDELSARIAQEASLFSLRNDIAEELARLRSHLQELKHLLDATSDAATGKRSTGKRLDFLCQEMNREANTLGSKSASLDVTHAALDLKLLIEQLREQAQNIE